MFALSTEIVEKANGRDCALMVEVLHDRAASLRRVGRQSEAAALDDSVRAIRMLWEKRAEETGTGS